MYIFSHLVNALVLHNALALPLELALRSTAVPARYHDRLVLRGADVYTEETPSPERK